MGFWQNEAETLGVDFEHPWVELFQDTLVLVNEGLYDSLNDAAELDAYSAVKVHFALEQYNRLLAEGTPEPVAREVVLADHLPTAPDEVDEPEDWEIEGAEVDAAAALDDWLTG